MVKQTIKRICNFMIANVLSFVPSLIFLFAVEFLFRSLWIWTKYPNLVDTVSFLICSLFYGFTFYRHFFVRSDEFKEFYYSQAKDGGTVKDVARKHILYYGKVDAVWIIVLSLIFCVLPQSITKVISILFASSLLFTATIPVRIAAILLWIIYVTAVYFVCMVFYYKKLEKKRTIYNKD